MPFSLFHTLETLWGVQFVGVPFVALGVGTLIILLLLTWVEGVGITLVSRRRGWRIHRGARSPVLALASYGWVIVGPLVFGTFFIVGTIVTVSQLAWFTIPFVVALLVFETLVYIGMQRMKYANAPGSERELAPEPEPPHPAADGHPLPRRGEGAGAITPDW